MKIEKISSSLEVFICNHHRNGEENCADKGAKDFTDLLKKWSKDETNKQIRVFRSGCLGKCSEGMALACYPDKKFILNVKEEDLREIKKGLLEALEEIKS
jgi:(2Fe-2S) ferredoxin